MKVKIAKVAKPAVCESTVEKLINGGMYCPPELVGVPAHADHGRGIITQDGLLFSFSGPFFWANSAFENLPKREVDLTPDRWY